MSVSKYYVLSEQDSHVLSKQENFLKMSMTASQKLFWKLCFDLPLFSLFPLGDHSTITSAKEVGTWGQKMAIFTDLQYYF